MTTNQRLGWWGRGLLVAGLAAIFGLAVWGVISRRAELAAAPRHEPEPVAVHTATAESGTLERTRRYLAEAEAVLAADVTARVTEKVTGVAVDEGERVAGGDVLALLDPAKVAARLEGVAADLDQARAEREAERANRSARAASADYWARELERLRRLRERDAASQSEVDEAADRLNEVRGNRDAATQRVAALTARIESLRAKRKELRHQKGDYTLVAPFDGVVTERRVDPGDQAAPGKALVRVAATDRMRLTFGVPRADRPEVAAGREVRFRLRGETRSAEVTRIHPALDDARLARAEADLPAGVSLPPGSQVRATVVLPSLPEAALVPASALAGGEERSTVYVVRDGKARARAVTVRGRGGDRVAVSGVEPGAAVIITPYLGWTRLSDGMPVTVVTP